MSIFQFRFQIFCLIKFLVVVIIIGRRLFADVVALTLTTATANRLIFVYLFVCLYCACVRCCCCAVAIGNDACYVAATIWLRTHTHTCIDHIYKSVRKFSLICDLCPAYQLSWWHQRTHTHTHRKSYIPHAQSMLWLAFASAAPTRAY